MLKKKFMTLFENILLFLMSLRDGWNFLDYNKNIKKNLDFFLFSSSFIRVYDVKSDYTLKSSLNWMYHKCLGDPFF